ncbi:hypothetical protein [Singulisphaera sp. PoT]|uniref:hypothetical protein n=1 Tax=Singulisphaera sp. PoT TaxID=3411797 RepID=UPI003BF593A4
MDLNIDVGPNKPLSDRPRSKPISRLQKNLLAFGIPIVVLIALALLLTSPPPPEEAQAAKTQGLSSNEKAVSIARIVESSLRSSVPGLDRYLIEVDVSAPKGYLVIKLKPEFNQLGGEDREALEESVALEWRQMKYAKDRGWDPRVEFVQYTETDQTSSHFVSPR